MVDTWVEKQASVTDVLVVWEFVDVFLEELPSVPPERRVEFRIDFFQGQLQLTKHSTDWHHRRYKSCPLSFRSC